MGKRDDGALACASVLVVDDDVAFRSMMRRRLVRHGYEVLEASDGEGALDALSGAVQPDVVVLDVMMPRCSGLGVLDILRTLKRTPPTLLVTGFDDRSVDVVAGRLGALRVFHKPFELDELLDGILEAAKGRRVVRSGR